MSDDVETPVPAPSVESLPYWEGLLEKKLLIQECSDCQKLRHYPRPICNQCYSSNYKWHESKGAGVIHSWVTSYHPFHPAFAREVPYVTVTVDLLEGVRMQAPLKALETTEVLKLGLRVELRFNKVNDSLCVPYFQLG